MILFAFLAQTLRIAIPYLLAAAGGVISERAWALAPHCGSLGSAAMIAARAATSSGQPSGQLWSRITPPCSRLWTQ